MQRSAALAERDDLMRERAEQPAAKSMSARSVGSAHSADSAKAATEAQTPERELERIAQLRRDGKHDEADKALAEFRKRYPDFKILGPMLERVERR